MTKLDKFTHLDNMDPSVKAILSLPVGDVDNKHLDTLKSTLENHARNSDPEVRNAAISVIAKIDVIMMLGKNMVSRETIKASNNVGYAPLLEVA